MGWKVLRVWECELAKKGAEGRIARRIVRALGRDLP
jgi:G:T-mismatch repair DNA endonuclease (very short patch repair protein)